jgi:phage gp29-like protein
MVAELVEASRSGSVDYATLLDRMNAAISKVVLSQTMTTDPGSSRAQAEVHLEVADTVIKADADLVCASFNRGPARWLTQWNFPGSAPPKVWRRVEDDPDLLPQAERDKAIVDMGFRPTLQYILDTYGGEWTESPRPATPSPRAGEGGGEGEDSPAFAEPAGTGLDQAALDALLDALPDADLHAQMEAVLAPVRAQLAQGRDYADMMEHLAATYPAMDTAQIEALLARLLFVAETWGRLHA